jgi:hypothetical protein
MLTITVLHNIRGDSPLEFDTSTEEGRKQAQEAFNKLLRAGTAIFLTRADGATLRVTGYDVHTDKLEVREEPKVTATELTEAMDESTELDKQRAEEVPEQLKGEKGEVGDVRQVKTKRPGGRRKVKVTKVDPQSGEIVAVAPVAGGRDGN